MMWVFASQSLGFASVTIFQPPIPLQSRTNMGPQPMPDDITDYAYMIIIVEIMYLDMHDYVIMCVLLWIAYWYWSNSAWREGGRERERERDIERERYGIGTSMYFCISVCIRSLWCRSDLIVSCRGEVPKAKVSRSCSQQFSGQNCRSWKPEGSRSSSNLGYCMFGVCLGPKIFKKRHGVTWSFEESMI